MSKKHSIQLDPYEQEIEDSIKNIKPISNKDRANEIKTLQTAAKNYKHRETIKDKRITIRSISQDLEKNVSYLID